MPGLVMTARAHELMKELCMELSARKPSKADDVKDLNVGELNSLSSHVAYQDQIQSFLEAQSTCPGCDLHVEEKFAVGNNKKNIAPESQVYKFKHRLLHSQVVHTADDTCVL